MDALLEIATNPFLDWLILATVIGQFSKTQVFTKARACRVGKGHWFWKWGRKTLAFHPVAAGAVIGIVWQAAGWPIDGWEGHASLYFGAAGVFSTWGFAIMKGLLKPMGVVIDAKDLPGMSERPPESETRDTPLERPIKK
jgi:hypothetical protein